MPDIRRISPKKGYAEVLYGNFDYFEETYGCILPSELMDKIDAAKQQARQLDKRGDTFVPFEHGGETFMVRPYGVRGDQWIFGDDDLLFKVRPPELPFHVTVRYLAAGLAEHGLQALKDRVQQFFRRSFIHEGIDQPRVSRMDYCFDVFSPEFTAEMVPEIAKRIVMPSGVKVRPYGEMFGTKGTIETLTIGGHKSPLSIQIYDKGKEIVQASGKTWMYDLWEQGSSWKRPPMDEPVKDVWRIEVRARRDWLKRRTLDFFEDFNEGGLRELLAEAFMTRRLTVPNRRDHRERWPVAPLWTLLLDQHPADHMRPLGRRFTRRADEIASMCIDNAVGNLRTASVLLKTGADDVLEEAELRRVQDPKGQLKLDLTRKRYAGVNDAR